MKSIPEGATIIDQQNGVTVVSIPEHPKKRFHTWNVEALQRDVDQMLKSIDEFRGHIAVLEGNIAERRQQIAEGTARDREIAAWEAKYGDVVNGDDSQ